MSSKKRKTMTFSEKFLKERWDEIYLYKRKLPIYDACHALEQFQKRFTKKYGFDEFVLFKILQDGLKRIERTYSMKCDKYMIISASTCIKVQLDLRPDRFTKKVIGVVATVLDKDDQPKNLQNDKDILVEKSKGGFFTITEGDISFQHIFEDGKYFKTFEIVKVA